MVHPGQTGPGPWGSGVWSGGAVEAAGVGNLEHGTWMMTQPTSIRAVIAEAEVVPSSVV